MKSARSRGVRAPRTRPADRPTTSPDPLDLDPEERALLEQLRRTNPLGSVESDPEDWPADSDNWHWTETDLERRA